MLPMPSSTEQFIAAADKNVAIRQHVVLLKQMLADDGLLGPDAVPAVFVEEFVIFVIICKWIFSFGCSRLEYEFEAEVG